MKNFINDASEQVSVELNDLITFLEEREAAAVWYTDEDGTDAKTVRFQPIYPEPLAVPAEVGKLTSSKVVKFDASEQAYADTMFTPDYGYDGSSQLVFINNKLMPVGNSAIRGILERAGIKNEGFEKLKKANPNDLSEVLNRLMKATKGKVTALEQDEKLRALNGARYAICPMSYVAKETKRWIEKEYPKAKFVTGFVCHDFAAWQLDLGEYTHEIFGGFPELIAQGFTPALTVMLSNTGTSAVNLKPSMKLANTITPLGLDISSPHIAKGTATDRTNAIKSIVSSNFSLIFPTLTKAANSVDKLRSVDIKNGKGALMRAMKQLGVAKKIGMEVVEQFSFLYPDSATAYDCYSAIIDAYSLTMSSNPSPKNAFVASDIVAKAIKLRWKDLDIPGEFSW